MDGYEVIPTGRLLSNIVLDFNVLPHDDKVSPQDFLQDIRPTVVRFLGERTGHKVLLTLSCVMERIKVTTGMVEQTEEAHFRTLQVPVYRATDLESMYETMRAKMLESFASYLRNGSGH